MAARKKATPVAVPTVVKPKRFEVGYVFPIQATIEYVDDGESEEGAKYQVNVNMYGEDSGSGYSDDIWYSRKDLILLESKFNPKVMKEELQLQLKEAQALVQSLTKKIESI